MKVVKGQAGSEAGGQAWRHTTCRRGAVVSRSSVTVPEKLAVGVLTAVGKRDATIAATQLRRCCIAAMITDGCLTILGAGIGPPKRAVIVSDCG